MRKKNLLINLIAIFAIGILSSNAQDIAPDNQKVNAFIKKKRAYNAKHGFGYRIQLYYGNEGTARRIKTNFKNKNPFKYCRLDYDKPYWKVKVGNYKTKLDADRELNKLKENFGSAIVVPM